jgi:trimeric autotransporter adhesin
MEATMAADMSTTAFQASIGVIASPDLDPDTLSKLQYMGITSVRAELPDSTAADAIAPYVTLAKAGITFDFLPAAGGFTPPMDQVQSVLDAIEKAAPGSIASVEGPNEPNIWPISYAGLDGTAAAVQYQADLYDTVHSDPLLAGVQVYDFPFGGVGPDTYAEAGDQTASVDATNIHVYPDGFGDGAPALAISIEHDLAEVSAPTKPMVMTEFGYSTYAGADIDQTTQARFEIDGLLDQQRLGVSKTFLYDTVDDNTGTSGYEDNFGQFASDGTPKVAGTALHNLSAILADNSSAVSGANSSAVLGGNSSAVPGASGTGPLPSVQAPQISGLPADANTLLLEKSDGTIDLAVWDEDASVNAHMVLSFATPSNVALYDPVQGSAPQSTAQGTGTFSFTLGTDPLVIAVQAA